MSRRVPIVIALASALFWGLRDDSILASDVDTQASPPPRSEMRCDVATLGSLANGELAIRSAEMVAAGGFTPPRASSAFSKLQAFCRVQGTAKPSADSLVTFEVWLPAAWNGKLVATGNGGYSNALNYADMAYALSQGYAALGGDTGHQTPTPDDLLWGVGHPERIVDWGMRSIHAILGPARRIVERVLGQQPRRAYFYGCSTGGHQAFAEMQRYPEDFDGVIAGAPGHNRVRLNAAFLWRFLANHHPGDNATPIVPASKLPVVTNAAVAACDANDGVVDGVVDDPRSCRFDPAALACRAGDGPDCLTEEQIGALRKMYAGPKSARTGEPIYPGWPPSSEALIGSPGGAPIVGWHLYWGTTEPTRANFWRHWVFENPQWDWWTFDVDRDVSLADGKVGRSIDQTSVDLGAFKKRRGKAIVYHGWQDPVANPIDTIAYYERLRAHEGSQREADVFFRLFLVPGMGHCSGGTGATSFGNQNAPSPIVDPEHDLLASLDAWVEHDRAPDRLIASRVVSGVTIRTRPLCPYPQKAHYRGTGSQDEAASFECRP